MPNSDDLSASKLGNWQFPAVLVAIFTFLGIRSGDPGRPASIVSEPKAESPAEEAEEGLPTTSKAAIPDLVDEFRPISPQAMLAVLQPLVKFYASEMVSIREAEDAKAGQNQVASRPAPNPSADSKDAEKTLDSLVSILRSESRKIRELQRQNGPNGASMTPQSNGSSQARPMSSKTLVGIVPDPKSSGIAYQYDSALFGIRSAFAEENFVIHSHSIPWSGDAKDGRSANDKTKESVSETGRLPGVILFRKPFGENGKFYEAGANRIDVKSPFELGLVLLVPEKPLAGIDIAVFLKALEIAEFLNDAVTTDEKDGVAEQPSPIRIFGPTYSGSDVSMLQTLRHWTKRQAKRNLNKSRKPDAPEATPSGRRRVVMLWHNGDALKFEPATYEIPVEGSHDTHLIQYRTFGPRDRDYVEALTHYVRKSLAPPVWNKKIAIVSEGSTTYGANFKAKIANEGTDESTGFKFFNYRYPLNIAEMRRRVEKAKKQGDDANLRIRTAEQLELDLGNDRGSDELIDYAVPEYSVNVDELRILRVAEDINYRRIRFVIIRSSDVRDLIFVCEFFREHCPDVQLLAVKSDITLNHSERIIDLRGLVVASGLPTYVGEPMGSNAAVHNGQGSVPDEPKDASRRGDVFPDSTAAANHVAVSEHLKWHVPDSNRSETESFPVRILVNSQRGFLPLGTYLSKKESNSGQDFELTLLRDRSRFLLTSGISIYLTIPIFMLGMFVFIWYRDRFANSLKQMSAVRAILVRPSKLQAPNDRGKPGLRFGRKQEMAGQASSSGGSVVSKADGEEHIDSDYLGKLQASARSFLNFLEMRATIFDHFRLIWNRDSLRIMAVPMLSLIAFEMVRPKPLSNGIEFAIPSLPRFFICVILAGSTDLIARWIGFGYAVRNWAFESRALRILRYSLSFFVFLFVWFAVSNLSTFESGLTEAILICLISISVVVVAVMTYRINLIWNLFSSISTNIQGLPMGDIFERLPRRLTSKPGDFNEIWFETNDHEVNPRIKQILKRTRQLMLQESARFDSPREFDTQDARKSPKVDPKTGKHKSRASNDTRGNTPKNNPEQDFATTDEFEFSQRLVKSILKPVWDSRLTSEAYADSDEKSDSAAKPSTDGNRTEPDLEQQAETLVAIMLVHFVNRGMDLVWTFIITTILLAMLMLIMVNSYPFQPAGSLSTWISLFVFLAIMSCFRVYFGMNRDGLLSRVHRTPDGKSIFDSDFLGKGLLYLAPVLTLLSSVSVGFSEVIRIVLLPIFS